MSREKGGFTLIELMIVIVIIGILTALMGVAITSVLNSTKRQKTYAFVKSLEAACGNYYTEKRVYPPEGTNALHKALGGPREIILGYGTGGPIIEQGKPYHSFMASQLRDPNADPLGAGTDVIDAWGNSIQYRGYHVPACSTPPLHNTKGVDIWSNGPNPDAHTYGNSDVGDDVCSWAPE